MIFLGLALCFIIPAWSPSAFFLFVVGLAHYAIHDLLTGRRLHDKPYFGIAADGVSKRDRVYVWYQILLIAGYGYLLACSRAGLFFYLALVFAISLTWREKLADLHARRRFYYHFSLVIGLGHSLLLILSERLTLEAAWWERWMQLVSAPTNLCGLAQVFDAFNALAAAIIQLLPFPLNVLLVPLNLNLLYGPLVAVGVLGVLKARAAVG
ncbi:MAG: hypothetical protein HQM02_04015 [Magnetococcales bacterium]|nr:hypothetical protein [Magnetococcales bacterium]